MGDDAKAEPLFRQALGIYRRVLGENHPLYATSMVNLAGQYQKIGNHAMAERLYLESLEIWKKAVGETTRTMPRA